MATRRRPPSRGPQVKPLRISSLGLLNAVLCCALIFAFGAHAALGACSIARGEHVALFGGVDDPDVLVWDSRDRLLEYAEGSEDTRGFLLPHAMLNRPGTIAVVQECVAKVVHSKFQVVVEDAVGVLILSGPYRGRYGWVSSSDLRGRGIPREKDAW